MEDETGQARACARIVQTEKRAFRRAVRQGGLAYSRSTDLRRVLPPGKDRRMLALTLQNGHEIRTALRLALRSMVQAKRQKSWRYSRARHLAILQALAGELRLAKECNSASLAASYAATAPPSGVQGSIEPVATPSATDIPLGSA